MPRAGSSANAAQSTPLQSGPIPGYVPRHAGDAGGARRRRSRPGDVIMHNDPYGGAIHGPDVAFFVPVFLDGDADRLLGHHGAPPRHRRADARQLRHRRRDRHLCRGAAVQGDQGLRPRACATTRSGTSCATTSAPPTSSSATWRRRSRPAAIGAERYAGAGRAATASRPSTRRLRGPDGLFRAADAPGHRARCPTATTRAETHDRRLSRRSRSGAAATCRSSRRVTGKGDSLVVDLTGTAPQVPDRPINMPLEGTVDCRGLADDALRPAGHRRATATSRRTRG